MTRLIVIFQFSWLKVVDVNHYLLGEKKAVLRPGSWLGSWVRDVARRAARVSCQNTLVQPLNKNSGRDNSFQYFKCPGGMQLFLISSDSLLLTISGSFICNVFYSQNQKSKNCFRQKAGIRQCLMHDSYNAKHLQLY